MIPLTRIRLEENIHANFHGDKRRQFEKELLLDQRRIARNEIEKHSFVSDRWKKAKDQLIAETGGKCAYCEAPTTVVAYGDVEHYRPKSTYWWLAYCYDNYLVSCQLCNQKYKKAKFPVKNARMRAPTIRENTTDAYIESKAGTIAPNPLEPAEVDDFMGRHQEERPLLLNPYYDNLAEFFAWRADKFQETVELIPMPGNPDSRDFCDAAIEHYGLNRVELKSCRWEHYEDYQAFRMILDDPELRPATKARALLRIEKMKAQDAPFAGMIRYFHSRSFA